MERGQEIPLANATGRERPLEGAPGHRDEEPIQVKGEDCEGEEAAEGGDEGQHEGKHHVRRVEVARLLPSPRAVVAVPPEHQGQAGAARKAHLGKHV